MKPAAFRYHAPKTVDEAVALLAEVAPEDGRVLAGGQSLVPTMAFRLAKPGHLVDINGIAALNRLEVAGGKLVIGACVRHAAFDKPVCDGPLGRLLSEVVRHIAHYPIRNRGTFCGSLAHADPASEWALVLSALDGEIVARSAVVMIAWKKSRAAMTRSPLALHATTSPSSAVSTSAHSEAGSAWARLPQNVPRLRIG